MIVKLVNTSDISIDSSAVDLIRNNVNTVLKTGNAKVLRGTKPTHINTVTQNNAKGLHLQAAERAKQSESVKHSRTPARCSSSSRIHSISNKMTFHDLRLLSSFWLKITNAWHVLHLCSRSGTLWTCSSHMMPVQSGSQKAQGFVNHHTYRQKWSCLVSHYVSASKLRLRLVVKSGPDHSQKQELSP